MELVAAHLGAASLSMLALFARDALMSIMARLIMPPLGFAVAWHAWLAADPAWMVAGFVVMGMIFLPFFRPGYVGWLILNPLIAIAYLAHLGWIAITA